MKISIRASIIATAVFFFAMPTTLAQDTIYLSVIVPPIVDDVWGDSIFDKFEEEHPGVEVVIVEPQMNLGNPPSSDIQNHLQSSANFVSSADVLYISASPYSTSIETTYAGHYLDLKPLIDDDPSFNSNDFYPAIFEAFEWNSGIWALPKEARFWALTYDPDAFDRANLNYPSTNWTLDDFAEATRALTQRSEEGVVPGFVLLTSNDFMYLLLSLSETGFSDTSLTPNIPTFTRPELMEALQTILVLQQEGSLQWPNMLDNPGWLDRVPMRIAPLSMITTSFNKPTRSSAAALPSGEMGIDAFGYAVSSGTAYPELSYALAKYLTIDPLATSVYIGDSPAYRYIGDLDLTETDFVYPDNLSPEITTLIEETRMHGYSSRELQFVDYVIAAYLRAREDNIDIEIALEDAEILARNNLQLAIESRESSTIVVSPPNLPPELATNEVALNFGVMSFVSPLPNHDHWQQFLTEFAERDPQVGHISLDSRMIGERPEEWDCFFAPGDITNTPSSVALLDLSPLMNADPDFNSQDFISSVLQSYQQDTKILGLPIALYPVGLWYDEQALIDYNLPSPINDWTIHDFEVAINTLPARPALEIRHSRIADLLLLITSYGGLPFDFRTDPPTLDFSSDKTVSAIEQILFLIESGAIEQSLFNVPVEIGFENPPFVSSVLDTRNAEFTMMQHGSLAETFYKLTTFPVGTDYIPMSFSGGGGYINADSPYPEVCYRLLTQLALRPDLYQAMPARYSIITDLQTPISNELITFYQYLAELAQDPKAIVIPRQLTTEFELFQRALELSLAGDVNLREALNEAEQLIRLQQ